jgi:alkanesulfonate monooxygenase SsuD/methylene tetrahydromethanopterin reductase-like flavin-dependent oxidoreductase (luciferase family)
LITSAFVITGRDAASIAALREQTRAQLAFYASTPTYRVVLAQHGWQDIGEHLSRLAATKRWHEMPALITDDMLHTFAVEATPDDVGPALRERYAGLIDRVALYLPFTPGSDDAFWRGIIQTLHALSR